MKRVYIVLLIGIIHSASCGGGDSSQSPVITTLNAFTIIQGYASGNDASLLTIQQLADAGVTALVPENLNAYKKDIADEVSIDSLSELQALVDNANTTVSVSLAVIDGYAAADDASLLTEEILTDTGIINISTEKLAGYKNAVSAAVTIGSVTALQGLIDSVNAQARYNISKYNQSYFN